MTNGVLICCLCLLILSLLLILLFHDKAVQLMLGLTAGLFLIYLILERFERKAPVLGGSNTKTMSREQGRLILSLLTNINKINSTRDIESLKEGLQKNELSWLSKGFLSLAFNKINEGLKLVNAELLYNKDRYLVKYDGEIKELYSKVSQQYNNACNEKMYTSLSKSVIRDAITKLQEVTSSSVNKVFKLLMNKIQWKVADKGMYTWAVSQGLSDGVPDIKIYIPDFENNFEAISNSWKKVRSPNSNLYNTKWDYYFRTSAILYHELWHFLQYNNLWNYTGKEQPYVRAHGAQAEWEPSAGNFILWYEVNKNRPKYEIYEFLLYHYNIVKELKSTLSESMIASLRTWNSSYGSKVDNNTTEAVSARIKKANTYIKHKVALENLGNVIKGNDKTLRNFWKIFSLDGFLHKDALKDKLKNKIYQDYFKSVKPLKFDTFWDSVDKPPNLNI